MELHLIDYTILVLYFGFVLGIGWFLRKNVSSSSDFLTSGHSLPLWITSSGIPGRQHGRPRDDRHVRLRRQVRHDDLALLLAGRHPGHAVRRRLHDAVLLRQQRAVRARIPQAALRRKDTRLQRHDVRRDDHLFLRHLDVCPRNPAASHLRLEFRRSRSWRLPAIVLAYTYLGGLSSAIYNEVLQFFLIVVGFSPLAILAVKKVGGWEGMAAKLQPVMTQSWRHMANSADNPMGVEVISLVMGLGFVLSFGYWCTNYLVVQRAMAARNMTDARNTPIVGVVPQNDHPVHRHRARHRRCRAGANGRRASTCPRRTADPTTTRCSSR